MEKFVTAYNPNDITESVLTSLDWDVIELLFTVDAKRLQQWYSVVLEKYSKLEFSFYNNPYIKEQYLPDDNGFYGYSKGIYGMVTSWGLDWPAETDLPIPPPFAAKLEHYPELAESRPYKIQEKFNFDYFAQLHNTLGHEAFKYSRITRHADGAGILGHIDGASNCIRLHIPIISHNGSKFLYGDNLERSYTFTAGNAYLINTSVRHSTTNAGQERSHIISDPPMNKILDLVSTTGQL